MTSLGWPICGRRPRRASSSTTRSCSRPLGASLPSASARSASPSATRSPPATSSSVPANSRQMEMEFFCEPGTDEEWHQYWIDYRMAWFTGLGIAPDNLRLFDHPAEKRSHYSKRTVDIEYRYAFTGTEWGELEGIANRTDFDLTAHSKASGADLTYFDQTSGTRWTPYVVEPAGRGGPVDAGVPARRLQRGRGAQREGRAREAHRAAPRPPARSGEGRPSCRCRATPISRRSLATSPPPCANPGTSTSTTREPSAVAIAGRTRPAPRTA